MGGGRQCLQSNSQGTEADPIDTWACYSKDGRDLFRKWAEDKKNRKLTHAIVTNNAELSNLDANKTDFVLGNFS